MLKGNQTLTLCSTKCCPVNPTKRRQTSNCIIASQSCILASILPTPASPFAHSKMSSATPKDEAPPALKGPSALRSIIAGSTAGAVEIGEQSLCRVLWKGK